MSIQNTAKVIQLQPKKATRTAEDKWGRAVMKHGFSIIPSLIFRAQARLGIRYLQLPVLLQLADHWWDDRRHPYPGKKRLAERLGLSERQVQRHIELLERAGLVRRITRTAKHQGRLSNAYDLSGLVKKLQALEPEFDEVKDMEKKVTRKGGLKVTTNKKH